MDGDQNGLLFMFIVKYVTKEDAFISNMVSLAIPHKFPTMLFGIILVFKGRMTDKICEF